MSKHFIDLFLLFDELVTTLGRAAAFLMELFRLAEEYHTSFNEEERSLKRYLWYAAHYMGAVSGSTVLRAKQRP